MKNTLYIFLLFLCTYSLPIRADKHCVFTPIDATDGLSDNKVRNITRLPDGRLMITTEGLLNLYDGTDFSYLHYGQQHRCSLSHYSGFHHEYIDAHGYMWLKNRFCLMAVDIGRECFVEQPDSLLARWGVRGAMKDFFMDKQQNLWVITDSDDLVKIEKTSRRTSVFLSRVSLVPGKDDQLYDLGVSGGQLYLFYRSGLLVCYDLASGQQLYRQSLPDNLPRGTYGNTSYVVAGNDTFYQLCNGPQGGLMLNYDVKRREWKVVLHTNYWLNYLSVDIDNSIWVSCHQGLWNIAPDLVQKQYIPTLKLVDGRTIDTEVSTLYNDNQGGMWVGTLNRGMLYYHPDRFRFQNIGKTLFPTTATGAMHVTGFAETPDKQLLVQTHEGIYQYHPQNGTLRLHAPQMLLSTSKTPSYDATFPARVLQTVALNRDSLVGITPHSWFVYDKRRRQYTEHPTIHACNALCTDRENRVWIGFEDGLMLWDASTDEQQLYYTAHGLINNSIRSLISTDEGTIWVSTAGGITRITTTRSAEGTTHCSFVNFNQFDGVLADEFCERSVFMAADGTLYWGGINGFNRYRPSKQTADKAYPPPLFVGLNLFGKRVERGQRYQGNEILKQPVTLTQELVLNHDQNFITLQFSALNYINPTQTYYRYRLQGIDKEEREIRSSNGKAYITYTDLPSGNYLLKVQAAGNGKEWGEEYAQLRITVKAPFWKTPYAYLLYTVLLLGAAVGGMLFYLKRKRRKLLREQMERLDEMKHLFLKNMNRELSEPVDRIIAPLDTVLRHTDEGRTKMQLQQVRLQAQEMKKLVGQLSEGVLLPITADEKTMKLDELLVNMRQLLEEQEQRKQQLPNAPHEGQEGFLSPSDEAFLRKALQYVEQNIDNPEYSVEVLSRDMGMDRTGLYRKLVSVVGKTPTNFIRSIRLQRAARLLEQGHTVAEVADSVGFSTSGYLSKCFQEEFGMRPSQYVNDLKKR